MILQRNMQIAIETKTDTNYHNHLFGGYVKPPSPPPPPQWPGNFKTQVNLLHFDLC